MKGTLGERAKSYQEHKPKRGQASERIGVPFGMGDMWLGHNTTLGTGTNQGYSCISIIMLIATIKRITSDLLTHFLYLN